MPDPISELTAGVARTEEAVKGLSGYVQAMRKDIDDLKPLSIFAEGQRVLNAHAVDDKSAVWKRIDEHRLQHESYAAIVNKAKGFMWAITGVWSIVGAISIGALAWLTLVVLDSKELLSRHDMMISELWQNRELVTIISGNASDPKTQQVLNQVKKLTQKVDSIDKNPATKIINIPTQEKPPSVEYRSGHPGK